MSAAYKVIAHKIAKYDRVVEAARRVIETGSLEIYDKRLVFLEDVAAHRAALAALKEALGAT